MTGIKKYGLIVTGFAACLFAIVLWNHKIVPIHKTEPIDNTESKIRKWVATINPNTGLQDHISQMPHFRAESSYIFDTAKGYPSILIKMYLFDKNLVVAIPYRPGLPGEAEFEMDKVVHEPFSMHCNVGDSTEEIFGFAYYVIKNRKSEWLTNETLQSVLYTLPKKEKGE